MTTPSSHGIDSAVQKTPKWALDVIGRAEHSLPLKYDLGDERVLVTGAGGSIGRYVVPLLESLGADVYATDIETLDVTDAGECEGVIRAFQPTFILHLAGAKHAPEGERDPFDALRVNAIGTMNILSAANRHGARVVLSSTGKAANPETAYGASKLIAERAVLNARGSVARFFNVVETQGNVFDIWGQLPEGARIDVAVACDRYFITLKEALALLVHSAMAPTPGRFVVNAGKRRNMHDVAGSLYPKRDTRAILPRRGDRVREPQMAEHETATGYVTGILRITSPHDNEVQNAVG